MEVGLDADDILLDWEPAAPKRGHNSPTFRPMHCGQTAGWIMMPLGTEVGLGSGHTVLDGDPALSGKGRQQPPLFGLRLLSQTAAHLNNGLALVMWPGVPLFWPGRPELSCCGQKEISYVDFLFTRITYTLR